MKMSSVPLNTTIRVVTPDQPNGFSTVLNTESDVPISGWDLDI